MQEATSRDFTREFVILKSEKQVGGELRRAES